MSCIPYAGKTESSVDYLQDTLWPYVQKHKILLIPSLFSSSLCLLRQWKVEELSIMHQLVGKEDQELKSRNTTMLEADVNSYQQIQANQVCFIITVVVVDMFIVFTIIVAITLLLLCQ